MKLINYLFLISLLASCTPPSRDREYFHIINRVEKQSNDLLKKAGCKIYATGGSCPSDLRNLAESFHVPNIKFTSIEEARVFVVEQTEKFLGPINADKEIRPYLHNYPFTSHNLCLAFSFGPGVFNYAPAPYIGSVVVNTGKVYYKTVDQKSGYLKNIHVESYETALQLYKEHMKQQQNKKELTQ